MKRPTAASLKKVSSENLVRLGPERLAEILVQVADSRPELKRRLRMELAAEQGAEHLLVEIDRRLGSIRSSRSRVSWRQRNAFVRDLDGLRSLVAGRLAALEPAAALDRLLAFLGLAVSVRGRVRDKEGEVAAVFERAARDLAPLVGRGDPQSAAEQLAGAIASAPADWTRWLPLVFSDAGPGAPTADATLRRLTARPDAQADWVSALRALADAAGDVDAYRATWTPAALKTQPVAAEVATRLLAGDRISEAGEVLAAAAPAPRATRLGRQGAAPAPEEAWEGAWIEFTERSGDLEAAQAARWASFERTLSIDRAKSFTSRLSGFDDVEAEERVFALARRHADFVAGLRLLMDWPAYPEAARMIADREPEAGVAPDLAELWAGRLRARFPDAANLLLRRSASAAFRRREYATADRLTAEADSIQP